MLVFPEFSIVITPLFVKVSTYNMVVIRLGVTSERNFPLFVKTPSVTSNCKVWNPSACVTGVYCFKDSDAPFSIDIGPFTVTLTPCFALASELLSARIHMLQVLILRDIVDEFNFKK